MYLTEMEFLIIFSLILQTITKEVVCQSPATGHLFLMT